MGVVLLLLWTLPARSQDGALLRVARAALPHPFELLHALRREIAALGPVDTGREAHRARVDHIFECALRLTEGSEPEALILASLACIPFRDIVLVTPIWHVRLPFSLSAETDEEFAARMRALPSRLFDDSPATGDADKLAHLFGAAWIAWTTRSGASVGGAGLLVEILENLFKLQGGMDPRDLRANTLGVRLARGLTRHPALPPSHVLAVSLGGLSSHETSHSDR